MSIARSMAAAKASTPKYCSDIQSLSARRHPGELQPGVGEVDLAAAARGVLEVGRVDLERLPEQVPLADEDGTALERLVEPLVRVQRHGVGQLEPASAPSLPARVSAANAP